MAKQKITVAVTACFPGSNRTSRFALNELQDHLQNEKCALGESASKADGQVELVIDPKGVKRGAPAESFRIVISPRGVTLTGVDAAGLLWAVRDFQHYYCREWLAAVSKGKKPAAIDFVSCPKIQDRGLWTWLYGCYDPYAYIDQASRWKYNTIVFWNRGVPMDAARLVQYAHTRGVKIWWGFSWGWVAEDLKDASPALAARLWALYEKQKREIDPNLANLDLLADETPAALMDYVLDVFEHQYAWIPDIDGIYFQSATEAINPRLAGKSAELGRAVVKNIKPIMEALHKRYPKLKISAGIHNTGDAATFEALRALPAYCNIMWENGVPWAATREMAAAQMALRGKGEDFAGVYRITMNCGMIFDGQKVQGEIDRAWLPRIEGLWNLIEEGVEDPPGKNRWPFRCDGKDVGYPCAIDWRPPQGKGVLDNAQMQQLLTWSRDLAAGPPNKGIFILVEAALWDLKPRRVPALAAEAIWDPMLDPTELERRCRLIWDKTVGGWQDTPNPYWSAAHAAAAAEPPASSPADSKDLGDMYKQDPRS
ncbi:MAG: hypothetical protein ABFD92_04770 [Planctomycetaceae bacterium]|nr:glycoside hydrolase family 20 zincin-like fold domain-containing protein [Planctomycetaceae bacterium]